MISLLYQNSTIFSSLSLPLIFRREASNFPRRKKKYKEQNQKNNATISFP